MIHITDGQTDKIVSYIKLGEFWNDLHKKSLKDNTETFDFTTFANEHLAKRNRVIIPKEDGGFIEFIIGNTRKYRNSTGALTTEVYTVASYTELRKAKVIYPTSLSGATAESAAEFALEGTDVKLGRVDYKGSRTLKIEEHTNPYSLLKRIASEFGLELDFRIEINGNNIVRYADLVERIGIWQGREVEFGKDLIGIERKENTLNIVTALVGLGPVREDGTRLEVFVEDKDALYRWGRNGKHFIETYEPQSTDTNMTVERLTELTQNELEKRVNAIVEYVGDIADVEKVPGLENKKIRFGDTIKIKDTGFKPALYLEARVHTQERSLSNESKKKVILGDYIEYTEEEVKAVWKAMQEQINERLAKMVIANITTSGGSVFKNGIGSTQLDAVTYLQGKEVDPNGMSYSYNWVKYDKDGNQVGTIQGKQISVNAADIDEKVTYIVTVGDDLHEMSSALITLTNVFDGEQGPTGPTGPAGKDGYTPIKGVDYFDGVDGQDGADGSSSYLWVKYSVNANGNPMTDNPAGALYIGVATTTTPTAPTSYTAYKWSRFKGDQGVQGETGSDGRTSYLHIKYSNDGGSTFTANGGETVGEWIGTYVDFNSADSSNVASYTWNKVKGDKGDTGPQGPAGKDGIAYMGTTAPSNPAVDSTWFQTDSSGKVIAIKKWTGSTWTTAKMDTAVFSVEKLSALSSDLGTVTAGILKAVILEGVTGTFKGDITSPKFFVEGDGGVTPGEFFVKIKNKTGVSNEYFHISTDVIGDKSIVRIGAAFKQSDGTVLYNNLETLYLNAAMVEFFNIISNTIKSKTLTLDSGNGAWKVDNPSGTLQFTHTNGSGFTINSSGVMGITGGIANEARVGFSLINGWANYASGYSSASYWKDKNGKVHLTGLLTGGTPGGGSAGACAILPAGYRPAGREIFSQFNGGVKTARVDVTDTGYVWIMEGAADLVSLAGISFKAEK